MTEAKPAIAITISRKKLLVGSGILIMLLLVGGSFLLINFFHNSKSDLKNQFSEMQKAVEFPLYYPSELPAGYSLNTQSLQNHGEIINFTVNHNAGQLIVTEQPLPPLMEDVKKLDKFDTKAGKAYIADLEGNIAGFIETEKTLVILSGATRTQTEQLRQLMSVLVKL